MQYHSEATKVYKKVVAARNAGKPLPPPPHVIACATGSCNHPRHQSNKGQLAPTEWVVAEPRPVPKNFYSRGWLRNIAEVCWPREVAVSKSGLPAAAKASRKGGSKHE